MTKYYIVNYAGTEVDTIEAPDNYWFNTPIKKEGYKHKLMAEISFIDHWKNSRSFSSSVTCHLYVYSYGKTYGHIINEELGDKSFGYDCIFYYGS